MSHGEQRACEWVARLPAESGVVAPQRIAQVRRMAQRLDNGDLPCRIHSLSCAGSRLSGSTGSTSRSSDWSRSREDQETGSPWRSSRTSTRALSGTTDPEVECPTIGGHFNRRYCFLPLYITCGNQVLAARVRRSKIDSATGALGELKRMGERIRGPLAGSADHGSRRFRLLP